MLTCPPGGDMPKLVVLNVGIEHSMGRVLPLDWLARSVMRQAWFLDEGDILVTPLAPDPAALEYIAAALGASAESVTVVTRERLVSDELLSSPDVVDEIALAMESAETWRLISCFVTPGIARLAESLRLPSTYTFASQRGSDLLNRKSGFRQLLAGSGLPLVDGCVAESEQRLAQALHDLLRVTGVVIVKRDDGAGGDGNVTVTTQDTMWFEGSARTVNVGSGSPADLAQELWSQLADWSSPTLVVEAYHPAKHRFYVEFSIDDPSGHPRFAHGGTIRSAPPPGASPSELVGIGLDIPLQLPPHAMASAVDACSQIAALAGRVGYRGVLNVDGIITEDDAVICNEVNARWGGGSVLHSIATRLLGPAYGNSFALSSARALPAAPLPKRIEDLAGARLGFDPLTGEGVLILACDPSRSETMECLLLARSRQRERELEQRLFELLGDPNQETRRAISRS